MILVIDIEIERITLKRSPCPVHSSRFAQAQWVENENLRFSSETQAEVLYSIFTMLISGS